MPSAHDIVQPGHIFPLKAQKGGVLVRAGHTEAGCDLAALAGLEPAAVICEILKEDGDMARLPDLLEFAKHARPQDRHHRRPDPLPQPEREPGGARRRAHGATATANSSLMPISTRPPTKLHLALVKGEIKAGEETLVRVHEPLSVLDFLDMASLDIPSACIRRCRPWPRPARA